jgi:hypothetical protein
VLLNAYVGHELRYVSTANNATYAGGGSVTASAVSTIIAGVEITPPAPTAPRLLQTKAHLKGRSVAVTVRAGNVPYVGSLIVQNIKPTSDHRHLIVYAWHRLNLSAGSDHTLHLRITKTLTKAVRHAGRHGLTVYVVTMSGKRYIVSRLQLFS